MYKPINLLIVDDDPSLVKVFEKMAKEEGWSYLAVSNGDDAIDMFNKYAIEAAVVDISLPGANGMQILEYVKNNRISSEIVMMTGVGSVETAVKAIKIGAYDYFTKPFEDINKVINVIAKAIDHHRLVQKIKKLERIEKDEDSYEGIIGKSRKMRDVFDLIDSVAPTSATILILGESGTGKELVAQAIHKRSLRRDKPFVVINCSAMPENLLESELFGHKKGSFTGAVFDKKGLFEEADGGTIFLDEIGEVSMSIQVKLLRVLQEGEIRAVGDTASKHVDVRLVAATNKDLAGLVNEGKFREDLYYRLNVIAVTLPPLRDRADDIPILAYHFLQKYSQKMNKKAATLAPDVMDILQHYEWVGNVRELENVIERSVVLADADTIHVRDLPPKVAGNAVADPGRRVAENDLSTLSYQEAKERAFQSFNKAYITNVMRQAGGNISLASAKAGMDRSNFKKILKKYDIVLDDLKKRPGQ